MTKVFALTNVHLDRRPFFDQVRRFRHDRGVAHMEITDYPDSEAKSHEVEDQLVQAVNHGDEVFIDGNVLPHTLNRLRARLNGYCKDLCVLDIPEN